MSHLLYNDDGRRFDGETGAWASLDGDIATVGISDHASKQYGEIAFIELPEPSTKLIQGGRAARIESTKGGGHFPPPVAEAAQGPNSSYYKRSQEAAEWASKTQTNIFTPVSGTIIAVNEELAKKPFLINHSPEGEGWIMKLQTNDAEQFKSLVTREVYQKMLA